MKSSTLCALVFPLALAASHADPAAELAEFSAFAKPDLSAVVKGKILTARSPAMSQPRHLSVQALYFVKQPPSKAAEQLRYWDATNHPQLKVYLHGDLKAKASPEELMRLKYAPPGFFKATEKLDLSQLQMSREEAADFVGTPKAAALTSWAALLSERAKAFTAGGLARQPAYVFGGETIRPAEEASALLQGQPKIRGRFASLINASGISGTGGSPLLTWKVFDVEGQPAVSLSASYTRGPQVLDLQYYASGGFFVHMSFSELFPYEDGTLIWRGDLISAPGLAGLRGVERMGSGLAMMREVEKTLTAFQKHATSR